MFSLTVTLLCQKHTQCVHNMATGAKLSTLNDVNVSINKRTLHTKFVLYNGLLFYGYDLDTLKSVLNNTI